MTQIFICECGFQANLVRAHAQCPKCKKWGTLKATGAKYALEAEVFSSEPTSIADVKASEAMRFGSGWDIVDVVLGGGFVVGSVVLLGGEPGIGKSTLATQIASHVARTVGRVLYVAGEESIEQMKLRTERLGVNERELFVVNESNLMDVLIHAGQLEPSLLICDSVQMLMSAEASGVAGSPTQVTDIAQKLVLFSKGSRVTTLLTCQVIKDGSLAGPKTLEHMVDTVLYFEQHPKDPELLKFYSTKNRFGERAGVQMKMGAKGLVSA